MSRADRMAEMIREGASRIIIHELSDPRIGFVTVTGADVSPDLAQATVRVSVLGSDADKRKTLRALANSASFIETTLFKRARIKRMPHLTFEFDDDIDRNIKMSELIREARGSDPDGGMIPAEAAPDPAEGHGPEADIDARRREPPVDDDPSPPPEEFKGE